jgi:hypothetical protein
LVPQDQEEKQDTLVQLVPLELLVPLDLRDLRVLGEAKENWEIVVQQEQLEPQVLVDFQDRLDKEVKLETEVIEDKLAQLDWLADRENRAHRDHLDP